MTVEDWNFPNGRFLAYILGDTERGETPLYVVLNAAPRAIIFTLPSVPNFAGWTLYLDTSSLLAGDTPFEPGSTREAPARSVLVFSGAS